MAGLENAALNGDLFRPQRSPSPSRSISTISSDEEEEDGIEGQPSGGINPQRGEGYSTGSRTGPKGVLSDSKEHDTREKNEQRLHLERVKREQEERAIIGSTVGEEEELREKEKLIRSAKEDEEEEDLDRIRRLRLDELRNDHHQLDMNLHGPVKRKGLREVGKEGFLNAVERPGWVVVLIYEPVSRLFPFHAYLSFIVTLILTGLIDPFINPTCRSSCLLEIGMLGHKEINTTQL